MDCLTVSMILVFKYINIISTRIKKFEKSTLNKKQKFIIE